MFADPGAARQAEVAAWIEESMRVGRFRLFRPSIEKKLTSVSGELRKLREDLKVIDEQLLQVSDEAEDSRLRALVSETPLAAAEHRDAAKAVGALRRDREAMVRRLQKLELQQDELLDQLMKTR